MNREGGNRLDNFQQIASAGATMAAMTEEVWGQYAYLGKLPNFTVSKANYKVARKVKILLYLVPRSQMALQKGRLLLFALLGPTDF